MSDEWIKVGKITVDAGLCWIGDPCYILQPDDRPEDVGEDWQDFCSILFAKEEEHPEGCAQFDHGPEATGLGVCVNTGWGDGVYDVFIKRGPEGRVAEARIVFITEDETDMSIGDVVEKRTRVLQ